MHFSSTQASLYSRPIYGNVNSKLVPRDHPRIALRRADKPRSRELIWRTFARIPRVLARLYSAERRGWRPWHAARYIRDIAILPFVQEYLYARFSCEAAHHAWSGIINFPWMSTRVITPVQFYPRLIPLIRISFSLYRCRKWFSVKRQKMRSARSPYVIYIEVLWSISKSKKEN